MSTTTPEEQHGLVPGRVTDEQFELLLGGTSIRGKGVIKALHDHLVNGLAPTAAWEKHAVNKSQFSLRLKKIHILSTRVNKLSKFYPREFKQRILATFDKAVAELEQAPKSLYQQKQGVALGLLTAMRECDFIDMTEYHELALKAHYVP